MKKIIISVTAATYLMSNGTFEENFLDTLQTVNEEVREQKINIDHTPSTVTVLRHNDLIQLGIQNLQEALTLIPGVEVGINLIGWKEVTIRGVRNSNSYGFDKVKILIDGVSVTTSLYGSVYYYLDFPVDMIDRIEVLRGPASAHYGSGAYSGAINVVTKMATAQNDKSLFLYGDSYTNKVAGTTLGFKKEKLQVAIDGYYQDGDKKIDTKKSISSRALDSDGESHEALKDYSVGLKVEYGDINWITRIKRSDEGNFYGPEEYAESDDDLSQINTFLLSEISYLPKSNGSINYGLKAGYNEYEFDVSARAFPKAFVAAYLDSLGLPTAMATEDNIYGFNSKEISQYGAVSVNIPVKNHKIKAEYFHKKTQNIKNSYHQNYLVSAIMADLADASIDENWAEVVTYDNGFIGKNIDRTLDAITLSDDIAFDTFDISIALRQDDYNHFEPVTSANIGAIFRTSETSNIKVAHGQAFRVPSWLEYYSSEVYIPDLYGNSDLKPEKIETTELFWTTIPNPNHRLRAGVFYSKMSDVIDIAIDQADLHASYQDANEPEDTYVNYSKRESQGLEVEYGGKLDTKNRITLSASYITTLASGLQPYYNTQEKDDAADVEIPDVSEFLANAIYVHSFTKSLSLASRVYYIGEKTMNASREKLDDFTDVTETLHYSISPDWQVSLSIKNLLDDKHYVPSSWAFHEDGLPREDRYYSMRVTGKF